MLRRLCGVLGAPELPTRSVRTWYGWRLRPFLEKRRQSASGEPCASRPDTTLALFKLQIHEVVCPGTSPICSYRPYSLLIAGFAQPESVVSAGTDGWSEGSFSPLLTSASAPPSALPYAVLYLSHICAVCHVSTHVCARRPQCYTQTTTSGQVARIIESQGHRCMFLPKYHCELNYIERYWGAAKKCACPPPHPSCAHAPRPLASARSPTATPL